MRNPNAQPTAIVDNGRIVDRLNTTTIPLGAGVTYTGAWSDCLNFSGIQLSIYSDQTSAVDGVIIQFSSNGINIDHIHHYTLDAGIAEVLHIDTHSQFYRVVYVNGTTPQTEFRLQAILSPLPSTGSVLGIGENPSPHDDTLLTKGVVTGVSTANPDEYLSAKITTDGGLVINQNILVDEGNSSTTNLAVGEWFTGTTRYNLIATGLQFIIHTDQNCKVYFDQSPDGTNWDISDEYDYYTSLGGNGLTVQLVSVYSRIRVRNVGLATTTHFRLKTLLVPMITNTPRSLDHHGNMKVHNYGWEDDNGFSQTLSMQGEVLIAPLYRLIGGAFGDGVFDTNFWTASLGTGGSIVPDGQISLYTGTVANNATSIVSTKSARFIAGQTSKFRAIVTIVEATNNTRRWGAFTANDGAFFEMSEGLFRLATRKAGITTYVNNGSFNGRLGNYHTEVFPDTDVYEIWWNALKVHFLVDGIVIHSITAITSPWADTLHFPIRFENVNINGSTTNVPLDIRLGTILRAGLPQCQPTSRFIQGITAGIVCKYGPGNLHGIVLSGITNNSVVTLYDNTAASGTVIWSSGPLTANGLPFEIDLKGVSFSNGLTATIATANLNVLVMYE